MTMLTIGLAGSMCTGKSLVLEIFKELGCFVAQADIIASELMFHDGSPLHPELIEMFGSEITNDDGELDQTKLRKMIFFDEKKRGQITDRVVIYEKEKCKNLAGQAAAAGIYPFFVYESAYLVESGGFRDFDRLIVTHTSREEHIKRLIERDHMPRTEAEKYLDKQIPFAEKLKFAYYTIDTSGTKEQTRSNTMKVFETLQGQSKPL